MPTTRFKGATAGERIDFSAISDGDMIQLRHKPGTIEDADKGISKSQLQSCPFGVSDTAAGTGAKVAALTDSNPDFTLVSGREVVVCFTVANTALNPTLNFAGSGAVPLYMPNGAPVGAWNAGAWMHLKYFSATVGNSQIQRWILMSQEVDNEVIMASSTTINGKSLISGSSIKIMFTADITGSNTTTGLSLTYNGTAYAVKVGKNGALANFNAYEVSSGVYKYLQAYTTLELAFDGTQFIIIGNPVVLSSADYTIYPDGLLSYKNVFNKIFQGAISSVETNTHISVNAGSLGRTLVIIGSAQWDAGGNTSSAIYVVRCGYDGNNWTLYPILEGNISSSFPLDISINNKGELILKSTAVVWHVSILSNR